VTAKWLIPTLAYIGLIGGLGVTSKLALRDAAWQDLILWTTVVYIGLSIALLAGGWGTFSGTSYGTWWALASGVLAVGGLVCLYLALFSGEASKVVPVGASYPAVTLVLAAIFLSESLSLARVAGAALVIGGVVIITTSN